MKIIVFIESANVGGAERMVLELLTLLINSGAEASFLGVRKGWLSSEIEKRGIPADFIEGKNKISFVKEIKEILKSRNADILHTHSIDSNFYGAIASKLAGCSHLATEHGDVHHTDKRRNLSLKLKFLKLFCSDFNAVSSFSKEKLVEFGVNSNKVSIIPNPVSLEREDFIKDREKTREETKAAKNTFIWMNLANLRPVKDQETLIKGFAESLKILKKVDKTDNADFDSQLWIVGQGDILEKLKKLAVSLNVDKKVFFLGHKDDPIRYLAASDGFILSSLSEAMPMSLIEAASMKLVLICSNVGGIPEIINEETGYLFESKDDKELARIMAEIVKDPENSAFLKASNALKKVKAEYSGESVLEKYLNRYRDIISS